MLKKQIAALNRILSRETLTRKDKSCGVHPAGDRYVVTDGHCAVLMADRPEGFHDAERLDSILNMIRNDRAKGNYILAFTVTADHIKQWKRLSTDWKMGKNSKTGATPVEITAKREDGTEASGRFNPVLLLDVAEAVGTGCMIYIGRNIRYNGCWNNLLIFPKDHMESAPDVIGYILPLRI